ncbi:hypothetical protein HLB23_15775 [Nocardia uniformis]|uniref:Uncharacterized protein n=1 Tax=Nocardia uniformis TaxID=53432 RepID=A0A849BXK3_9NOCA|nr:hypothetical protein [Nocardia uniformis]NNH71303.1 hypothetical protein [Nocardia uniformis]
MSGASDVATVSLPPWPAEWGQPRPRAALVFVLVFFSLVSFAFIPFTFDGVESGDGLRAIFGVVGFLVGLTFVAIVLPQMRVRRSRLPVGLVAGDAENGTAFRLSLVRYWLPILAVWLGVGVVFLAIWAMIVINRLFGRDDDRTSTMAIDVVQLVFVGAFIALFLFLIGYFFTRKRGNYVQLDADTMTQVIGAVTKTISWEEIGAVVPCIVNDLPTVRIMPAHGSEIRVDTGKSRIDRWQRPRMQREIDLQAAAFGIDPALLLYLVQYYQQHADARDELASSAVIDRIRRGDLVSQ